MGFESFSPSEKASTAPCVSRGGLVEEGYPPSDVMLGGGREEEEAEEEEGGLATFSSPDWRHIRSATKGDTICTDFFRNTPHHPNAVNAGRAVVPTHTQNRAL